MNKNVKAQGAIIRRRIVVVCALLATTTLLSAPVSSQTKINTKPNPSIKATSGKTSSTSPNRVGFHSTPFTPALLTLWKQEYAVAQAGVTLQKTGDYAGATSDYTQAHLMVPDDTSVVYHLAECAEAMGDNDAALNYYRSVIYTVAPIPSTPVIREADALRLMPFTLLLDETGHTAEAVTVYNYAVARIDFDPVNGKQAVDVLLPQFGDGPGQVAYSPEGLEAMTRIAISMANPPFDLKQLHKAVALVPDSAVAQYYLGKALYGNGGNNADAKIALQQAVQLGDDQTVAAAKEILQFLH